ncbi:hypothetical protein MSAN_00004400 [Mycena sanguinolenta]|uniref:Uncharacterized protein n=1 Tax=Mycena sanguinolenta TaxID=230812 RepID=A0A8H6ZB99_9AGAR|nr:hypothetical protein MSAN_00004400 [Mycena sanguinolenta]
MFINFRTFRKILLGVILLVSVTSLVLSIYLKPSFVHPNSAYVLVAILDTIVFAVILSIIRKPFFHSPQPVATEALGLFTLLPFALILVLYSLTLSVTPDPTALEILAVLQILIFIGTILHGLYTMGLIWTAMITVCVFDRNVWSRDIESSPSPFPMAFLLGFICPCFRPDVTCWEDAPEHSRVVCLPGCNCSVAKTQLPSEFEGNRLEPTSGDMQVASRLSSGSLVRVPNDVERRLSIVIAFEEV